MGRHTSDLETSKSRFKVANTAAKGMQNGEATSWKGENRLETTVRAHLFNYT